MENNIVKELSEIKGDWLVVKEGELVKAFRKSNVNAVVQDPVFPNNCIIVAGGEQISLPNTDVKTVLADIFEVDN